MGNASYFWGLTFICSVSLFVLVCEAVLGPPCKTNEECFENADCTAGECQCGGDYVITGDWTKCLPVISAPYSSKCEENPQCSARMGQGAICSGGICVCQAGYHYLHGICHKSAGYGDPCEEEDDCYGDYSYEALSCASNKTCVCAEGFQLVKEGYKTCRRGGLAAGDECFFDIDCKGDNMSCDSQNGICVDNDPTVRKTVSNTERSSMGVGKIAGKDVGSPCIDSSECLPQDRMECLLGVCVCRAGFSELEKNCMKDIGEVCGEDSDCSHIKGTICGDDKRCRCKLPQVSTQNNTMCLPGRAYNIRCQESEQCMFYGAHASCQVEGKYQLCLCDPNSHLVEEVQLCIEDKGLGESCLNNFDCVVEKSICEGNYCQCQDGFHANGAACVKNVEYLGDYCLTADDCIGLPNSTCTNNKCLCITGYFAGNDVTCLAGVSADCSDGTLCLAELSVCGEDGTCVCVNDTVPNAANSKCLPVGVHGSTCEENVQCIGLLGEEGGDCVDGVCACIDGYHYRNEYCWETRYVGEVCEMNSQCFLSSQQFDRIHCQNRLCECGFEYQQTHDLDCRAGVGRSSSSAIITGLCLIVALLVKNRPVCDGWTAGRP